MRRNSTSNKDGGGTFLTSVSASVDIEEVSFHLRLFKEHVDQIVRHPLSTYPKYLKSVLLSLSFYSDHKFYKLLPWQNVNVNHSANCFPVN